MGRPYKLTLHYQHDEEILETSIYYFNAASDDLEMPDLTNLCAGLNVRIENNLDDIVASGIWKFSTRVTTPAIGAVGPARYILPIGSQMPGDGTQKFMDSIVANVTLRGENAAEETVTGGMRLSIVAQEWSTRNQLDANFVSDLESNLNIVFPPTLAIGTGTLDRSIKSVRPPADPEYVKADTLVVSNRVGTNITRVGNRPQRNTGPVAP